MELQTHIDIKKTGITLEEHSSVMLIGSCFAENVGERLKIAMGAENVMSNPFGVLYNPLSIADALLLLIDADGKDEHEIEQMVKDRLFLGRDNIWHSWYHNSHYSSSTREGCMARVVRSISEGSKALKRADVLIITFGTTRCYIHHGYTVANCHKEPQSSFTEYEPSLSELKEKWNVVTERLRTFNRDVKIIFTVSPYRYKKYGYHESQIQKAKLLLLVHEMVTDTSEDTVCYFPSYEIMLDELRDYRFYAKDMLHPSDLAVDIITERFMEWCFSPSLILTSKENAKKAKQLMHRENVR